MVKDILSKDEAAGPHVELTQAEFDSVPYAHNDFNYSKCNRWRGYDTAFNQWVLTEKVQDDSTPVFILRHRIIDIVSPLQRAEKGPHDKGCDKTGFDPETGRYCCDTFAANYIWGVDEAPEQDIDVIKPGVTIEVEDPDLVTPSREYAEQQRTQVLVDDEMLKQKIKEVREEIRQEQEGVDPTRTIIEINATHTVLKPGDRVLVTVPEGTDNDYALMVKDELQVRFPEVEFTMLAGAGVIVVPYPTDEERAAHPEARQ